MPLEVANVVANYHFKATGVPQLVQQTSQAKKAMDQLGIAGDGAAAKLQLLEVQLQQANAALGAASAQYDAAIRSVEGYASSLETLQVELKAVEESIKAAKDAGATQGELMDFGVKRVAIQRQIYDLGTLADAKNDAAEAGQGVISALSKQQGLTERVSRGYQQLAGSSGKAGGKLQTMVRNFAGLQGAARGGVQGISQLATSLGRLGPIAAAVAVAIMLVLKVWKAFGAISAVSHIRALSDDMVQLADAANIVGSKMKSVVNATENFLRSANVGNVQAMGEEIQKTTALLGPLAGGFEQASKAMDQIMRGNAGGLEAFGFDKEAFGRMERMNQLMTEADKIQARLNFTKQQAAEDSDRVAAAEAGQMTAMQSMKVTFDELFEKLAQDFAPALEGIIELIEILAMAIRPNLILLGKWGQYLSLLIKFINDAAKALINFVLGALKPFIDMARHIPGIGDDIGKMADALQAWVDGGAKIPDINDDITTSTNSVADAADAARRNFEAYLSSVSGGQGIVSAAEKLGEAVRELNKDPGNPQKALKVLASYEDMFNSVINSPGGLTALKDYIKLFEKDMDPRAIKAMREHIEKVEKATAPLDHQLGDLGVTLEGTVGPIEGITNGFNTQAAAAEILIGRVDGVGSSLNALDGTTANTSIYVGLTGPGVRFLGMDVGSLAGSIGSFFSGDGISGAEGILGDNSSSGPSQQALDNPHMYSPAPARPSAASTRAANRAAILGGKGASEGVTSGNRGHGPDDDTSIQDFADIPSGGRSGGGGGGGRDRDLDIEEIRKFIETVNQAVQAGIRGGVVYSTAGNAIPIGGPGEFVKNDGGTNIGTINLRGVWDFADPAAKREIVRQLQEALAQYQKEVS